MGSMDAGRESDQCIWKLGSITGNEVSIEKKKQESSFQKDFFFLLLLLSPLSSLSSCIEREDGDWWKEDSCCVYILIERARERERLKLPYPELGR